MKSSKESGLDSVQSLWGAGFKFRNPEALSLEASLEVFCVYFLYSYTLHVIQTVSCLVKVFGD